MQNKSMQKQMPVEGVDNLKTDAAAKAEMAEATRKRKLEQWEREQAADMRFLDESRRAVFTAFRLWTVCPEKVCTRAKACRGDVLKCLRRWREHVPDEMRTLLHKSAELCRQGMSWRDSVTTAYADMERHAALMDEYAARRAADMAQASPLAPDTAKSAAGAAIESLPVRTKPR